MSVFDGFKFRNVTSPIHDIDPRAKFLLVSFIFIVAVLYNQLIPLLIIFFIQIPIIFIADIKKEWIKSIKHSLLFAILIFLMNFLTRYFYGNYDNFYLLFEDSLALSIRFIVLLESLSIFFLTTSPDMLGLALEQSGFPYELCFAFTTAVRFVPVLAEEAQTISDAQKARGLELESGNFLKRIKNFIPILIPLIINSIRRSLELAETMESRAWGVKKKRTNLYVLKLKKKDLYLFILSFVFLIISVYFYLNFNIPSISQIFKI